MESNDLIFGSPRVNRTGARSVSLKKHNHKLRCHTPRSNIPFGISEYQSTKNYSITQNLDSNSVSFVNYLNNLDSIIIEKAHISSKEWFGKELSIEKIKEIYNPSVKGVGYQSFRARLQIDDVTVWDPCNKQIPLACVMAGCDVKLSVECSGIYFIANEFGLSWKILQIKLYPDDTIKGYAFLSDSSDDSEAEPN